jgi:ADP-ribose pyrophosphatase YjhB (NUDIX family)
MKGIRHCTFCGGKLTKKYVPAEKRRRLVCRQCRQITYVNPKVVAGLIPVMPGGRVVLLKRGIEPAKGKWSYPAGFQELGETISEAAVRETKEEVCVKTNITRFVGVYSYRGAGVDTVVFAGRVARGQKPRSGQESLEVKPFLPSKIPWKDLAFRSTVHALRDWVQESRPGFSPRRKP